MNLGPKFATHKLKVYLFISFVPQKPDTKPQSDIET